MNKYDSKIGEFNKNEIKQKNTTFTIRYLWHFAFQNASLHQKKKLYATNNKEL